MHFDEYKWSKKISTNVFFFINDDLKSVIKISSLVVVCMQDRYVVLVKRNPKGSGHENEGTKHLRL